MTIFCFFTYISIETAIANDTGVQSACKEFSNIINNTGLRETFESDSRTKDSTQRQRNCRIAPDYNKNCRLNKELIDLERK